MPANRRLSARERRLGPQGAKNRRDPARTRYGGMVTGDIVEKKDPRFHYVLAYMNHPQTGEQYYAHLGYHVVKYGKDSPQLAGYPPGKTGEPITYLGHVLMALAMKAEKDFEPCREDLEEYGPMGTSGNNVVDFIEDVMLDTDKPGVWDPSRGMHGANIRNKYFSVVDDRKENADQLL